MTKQDHETKAAELWASFTSNQRGMVRFGIFPAEEMSAAEGQGYNGHALCVALMDCASNLILEEILNLIPVERAMDADGYFKKRGK